MAGPHSPLHRALVALLPVLPGAMGGPGARDFSALQDTEGPQDTSCPWQSYVTT